MRLVVKSVVVSICCALSMGVAAQASGVAATRHAGATLQAPKSTEDRLASLEARAEEQRFSWLTLIVGLSAAIVAALSLINGRRQTLRDGMFKCFEGYLKVMDYKTRAIEAADGATPKADEYQRYMAYYRALFDLLWTEYYLWKNRTLRDEPYVQWLIQRQKQFGEQAVARQDGAASRDISYRIVWDTLKRDGYYDAADPFVRHMDRVHGGQSPSAVLRERKPLDGWW